MKSFFGKIGTKISEFWKKLQKPQRIIIIAVAAVMIIGIIVVLSITGRTKYTALFSGMDSAEAGEVFQKLKDDGIDAQVTNGTVMVPEDMADTLRLQLNAEGYPSQGLNYDFYTQNASTFGMTEREKRTLWQIQLQQNIAQTLRKMEKIKDCTVVVNLGEESRYVLSAQETDKASASVTLELVGGQQLTKKEAETVRAVVAKSVPGLSNDNITIADTGMNSYTLEGDDFEIGTDITSQLKLTEQVRKSLEEQLVKLYAPVFGAENLSASVSVVLDFDKATVNTITLSPITDYGDENNIGIVTNMKRTRERILNGTEAVGEPGVDSNGGVTTYEVDENEEFDSTYYKITEEYNAKVNEINETLERAQGAIKSISCTLLINGSDEISSLLPDIRSQISTAIGVPIDNISVMVQSFGVNNGGEGDDEPVNAPGEVVPGSSSSNTIMIIVVAAVLAGVIILLIVLMSKKGKKKQEEIEELQRRLVAEQNRGIDVTVGDIDEAMASDNDISSILEPQESDNLSAIRKLVDSNPEAVSQLLRNWLYNDYRR